MEMSAGLRDAAPQLQALLDERILDLPDRLLDLLPVGVYVCDQAGLIVRYNRVAAELWGCTPQLGDPAGSLLRFLSPVRAGWEPGASRQMSDGRCPRHRATHCVTRKSLSSDPMEPAS